MQGLYHGCQLKNRNGTRRKIDYRRGLNCLAPTIGARDLLKLSIWSGNPIVPGREPCFTRTFMQSSNAT